MKRSSMKLGVVARGPHGHMGIVLSEEAAPDQDWIEDQLNVADIRKLGATDWWGVLIFEGGYLLSPGPLLTYVRDATYDDFIAAADAANASGCESLVKTFPHYVERLLAERREADSNNER